MSCRAVQAVEFAKTSLGPKLWSRRPTVQQHTPTGDDPAKAVSRRPLDEKRKLPEQIGSVFFWFYVNGFSMDIVNRGQWSPMASLCSISIQNRE